MKLNLIGKKFGRLTVIQETNKPTNAKGKYTYWLCKCDCGNIKITVTSSLTTGRCSSCGCLQQESILLGKYKNNDRLRRLKKLESYFRGKAKYNKRKYNLNLEELESLVFKNCYYCGKKPSNIIIFNKVKKENDIIYSGLDRIDSNKGYEINNVVPCCIECNQAKNSMSKNSFLNHIEKIYKHSIEKKYEQ